MRSRKRITNGFTLIELLVVVSIISLLVAILLPSLAKAREAAIAAVCASQVRGLGMGWTFYADDNNDSYPMGLNWNTSDYWWRYDTGVGKYMPTPVTGDIGAPPDLQANADNFYPGWRCPKHADLSANAKVGYHFNPIIGYRRYTKRSTIRWPAEGPHLFCFWDLTRPNLPLGNYFSCPLYDEESSYGWHFMTGASNVHGVGTNFLLFDGHVERILPLNDRYEYTFVLRWRL